MDRLVVMFGGSGFLGRYIAQELLGSGARVRFAERDPRRAWYLKPLGNLGQTQFVAADVTHKDSVARAVQGADAVINLVGILSGKFDKVHVEGARNVAEAAAAAGVATFVHMSAIGASAQAESAYGRTKGLGEEAVRKAFPAATILRPSIVFGREDNFINRFAGLIRALPVLPVIRSQAKFQPVYAGDIARAAAKALLEDGHAGKAYELGGPHVLTMGELNAWIAKETGRHPLVADVPDALAGAMARFAGWLPGAPITWDQWLMLQKDNVAADTAEGLGAFGITPTPLAAVAPGWLVQYRRHGRFAGVKGAA
ncbi:complex I NDUFA9 subunit family protein [Sphingomonas cavernae]|nr:complex I NDUFA9 subunit family protein [Sphingomonas cavernae]